jgi:hypothetical protein
MYATYINGAGDFWVIFSLTEVGDAWFLKEKEDCSEEKTANT